MYRVLLVDDEINIVDALFDALQQMDEDDLEYLKAYSGSQALEYMQRGRIDLVVTDISMPNIDGIELLRRVSKAWPHCKVIMLSCFEKFDFAFNAANLKCFRYLMKTDGYDVVHRTIREAIASIEKEVCALWQTSETNDACYVCHRRNDFLMGLLYGDYYQKSELSERLSSLQLPLDADLPLLHFMVCIKEGVGSSFAQQRTLLVRMEHRISRLMEDSFHTVPLLVQCGLFCFVQQKDDSSSELDGVTHLQGLLEILLDGNDIEPMGIMVTEGETSWEEIGSCYDALIHRMRKMAGLETGLETVTGEEITQSTWRRKTTALFDKTDAAGETMKRMKRELAAERQVQSAIHGLRWGLLTIVAEHLTDQELSYDHRVIKLISNLSTESAFEEVGILTCLDDVVEMLDHDQRRKTTGHAQKSIDMACHYIEKNYAQNISLSDIARSVYLNASYLSRLFKQQLGINLVNYINKVRIENAQNLLTTTNKRIADISKEVGFSSPGYFSAVFRRFTGVNPVDYKGLILRETGKNGAHTG